MRSLDLAAQNEGKARAMSLKWRGDLMQGYFHGFIAIVC